MVCEWEKADILIFLLTETGGKKNKHLFFFFFSYCHTSPCFVESGRQLFTSLASFVCHDVFNFDGKYLAERFRCMKRRK